VTRWAKFSLKCSKQEDDELKKTLDNLPPAAQAAIDAIWKDREELVAKSQKLEKDLGEEIAKRSRREYLGKAEKTLCNIPGHSLDEVVDLMIEVKATNEELGARVEKALEASSAALQGGALLVEAGRSVPDTTGGKTIQTNPALYEEYNLERRGGN